MIDDVRKKYSEAFRAHGDDDRSVFFPKGRQFNRYQALIPLGIPRGATLLDYGCGLGKMYDWLGAIGRKDVGYCGVDITHEFIEHNRNKYPLAEFRHLAAPGDLTGEWDIVAASGVFSILYTADRSKHLDFVFQTLSQLFHQNTKQLLSVDFMHDEVDYQQEGAFHLSVAEAQAFVSAQLSKRYEIIRSHLPYEFSIKVWKDTALTSDGVYKDWT